MDNATIEAALQATGELIAARGAEASILVVGGASLAVLGLVPRVTNDVDVIALASRTESGELLLARAKPLPKLISDAATTVARNLGLPADWLNAEVGAQFDTGLPPDIGSELTWRGFAALQVGFVGRGALIKLKLFAAADNSPASVHTQDLIIMRPTRAELHAAAEWVIGQDASPTFGEILGRVIEYVIAHER